MVRIVTICVLFLGLATGCASHRGHDVPKLSVARPSASKTISRTVKRADFIAALEKPGALQKLRLVEAYHRGGTALPEYRLFGIEPGSPYAQLGLETADVLLAANDFVILEPEKFRIYVSMLRNEREAHIDILRYGERVTLGIVIE